MNRIELTVALEAADRERIDALTAAVQRLNKSLAVLQNVPQNEEAEPVKETIASPEKAQEIASQEPEPQPEPVAPTQPADPAVPPVQIEAASTHNHEDVQRKVVELCAAGKKLQVKEIVNVYAERVSAIPADKLDEVMGKLIALEG